MPDPDNSPQRSARRHQVRRIGVPRARPLALPMIGLLLGLGGIGIILFNPFEVSPTAEPTHIPDVQSTTTPPAEPIPSPDPTTAEPPQPDHFMTDLSRRALATGEIDDPDSLVVVVNKHRPFREEKYEPPLENVQNSAHKMQPEAATALEDMLASASDDGVSMQVLSAYRSHARQHGSRVHNGEKHSGAALDEISARPGFSEHQTGLVADLGMSDGTCALKTCFADTSGSQWLQEHASDYGFIVRYPKDQRATTGYVYEPWHLRFIGAEAAADMQASGAPTLEQYFGLPAAPYYED